MGNENSSVGGRPGRKQIFFKRKGFIFFIGLLIGCGLVVSAYKASVYFSSDESCMKCHVHPHVEDSWKLSKHVNNGSGVKTHCVECHLPPQSDTWAHYTAKASLGLKGRWGLPTGWALGWGLAALRPAKAQSARLSLRPASQP